MNRTRPSCAKTDAVGVDWSSVCAPSWIPMKRLRKRALILKPSSFMRFHRALVGCKYRWLYSSAKRACPGPKGPTCPAHSSEALSSDSDGEGVSWLTAIGHAKDSLWSLDLFRCESILLQSYWVMVVLDVFTRRIIGVGVERGNIDGIGVCRMFNRARAKGPLPNYVSTQRSIVPLLSVVGQSTDSWDRGDQERSVCTAVAPFRRTPHRYTATRISRSSILLERDRSGVQARCVLRLL